MEKTNEKTKQIKKAFTCSYCGRTGHGYENERWTQWTHHQGKKTWKEWQRAGSTTIIPDGWKGFWGFLLCSRCVKNPDAIAKAQKHENHWVFFVLACVIAVVIWMAVSVILKTE